MVESRHVHSCKAFTAHFLFCGMLMAPPSICKVAASIPYVCIKEIPKICSKQNFFLGWNGISKFVHIIWAKRFSIGGFVDGNSSLLVGCCRSMYVRVSAAEPSASNTLDGFRLKSLVNVLVLC